MNETQIQELIDFIKADTALKAIFADRVTYLQFVNEQTEACLLLRDLTENRQQATNESLIEFRIISPSQEIGPIEIRSWITLLKDTFEKNSFVVGTSTYYQVDCLNDVYIEQNVKSQYEAITSMIFKKTR